MRMAKQREVDGIKVPNYDMSTFGILENIIAFIMGGLIAFVISYLFFKIKILSVIAAVIYGFIFTVQANEKSKEKRRKKVKLQFFDMLEAMSVALRAGNPPLKALESARGDLLLTYPVKSDIIVELNLIIGKFNNSVPLSEGFNDFANRSQVEDISSFANVFATIEGKSGKANEIVTEVQEIMSDKAEIEMEIDTMMLSAKTEVYTMLVLPLLMLMVIGYMGAGFMDALYTTAVGRIVSFIGLLMYGLSYLLAKKLVKIDI